MFPFTDVLPNESACETIEDIADFRDLFVGQFRLTENLAAFLDAQHGSAENCCSVRSLPSAAGKSPSRMPLPPRPMDDRRRDRLLSCLSAAKSWAGTSMIGVFIQ